MTFVLANSASGNTNNLNLGANDNRELQIHFTVGEKFLGTTFPKQWIEKRTVVNKIAYTRCDIPCKVRQFPVLGVVGNPLARIEGKQKIFLKEEITINRGNNAPRFGANTWYSFSYKDKTFYISKLNTQTLLPETDGYIPIKMRGDNLKVGDSIFLNACRDLTKNHRNIGLNIENQIVEVPNRIRDQKFSTRSKKRKIYQVVGDSQVTLPNEIQLNAKLKNFRELSIFQKNRRIYKRYISGTTSLYELKFKEKVIGWGVGWHKHCKKYYKHADFTVMRLFIPKNNKENKVELDIRLLPIVNRDYSSALKTAKGLVIVEGQNIGSGYRGCYYCLPGFYFVDQNQEVKKLSNPESLKAAGIDFSKLDPFIYTTWLINEKQSKHFNRFVDENFGVLVRDSEALRQFFPTQPKFEKEIFKAFMTKCHHYLSLGSEPLTKKMIAKCY